VSGLSSAVVLITSRKEDDAALHALAALEAHGYAHDIFQVAVTDMRTIKIRRKGRDD
jgi:hypothetical protein